VAFFQTKWCYSPKIEHFAPQKKILGWLILALITRILKPAGAFCAARDVFWKV